MSLPSLVLTGTDAQSNGTSSYDLLSGINWVEYYPRLIMVARRFVFRYRISCWYGQEEDIIEDVAQETVRRMIDRTLKAARGEASPIDSLEHMMIVIARNYVLDLRRHDRRVVRLTPDNEINERATNVDELESISEMVTEQLFYEWLFLQVAHEIIHLPCKQRRAILIELANRTSFSTQPTPLQEAFLSVGIDLQEYEQLLPENPVERARHASLVSLAYKRVSQAIWAQHLFSGALKVNLSTTVTVRVKTR